MKCYPVVGCGLTPSYDFRKKSLRHAPGVVCNGAVLNVRVLSDADEPLIAPEHDARPNVDAAGQADLTDDAGVLMHPGLVMDLRRKVAISLDHLRRP